MSKTPNYDAKVKSILDTTQAGERVCALTGEGWVMKQADVDRFRRFNVPPLSVSPETFTKQYMALHTGYSWWWNTDAETGKPILTYMHPSRPYKVISDESWRQKDFTDRGRDVSAERPFFDQLTELAKDVPMSAWKNTEKPVNSIARISLGDENSYFVAGTQSKNCCFCSDSIELENSVEVTLSSHVSDSYNVNGCQNMHRCRVARDSNSCVDCAFIFDCRDCEHCFFSTNKRHKRYLWRNEQLSKEEWERRWKELDLGSAKTFYGLYDEFRQQLGSNTVWPENFNVKSEGCTGEYLINCVNVERGWYSDGAKDCWWCVWGQLGSENNALGVDVHGSEGFGNGATFNSQACRYSWFVNRCRGVEYCIECDDCEDCFGCIGIRRKQFHILNKPYREMEYWNAVDDLKCAMVDRGEYGCCLPQVLAQTPYHDSAAQTTFRTSTEDRRALGVLEFDPDGDGAFGDWSGKEKFLPEQIPDHIDDVGDEWLGRVIWDEGLRRPYGILKPELEFYRRMRLPVRREHFVRRIQSGLWEEMNLMNLMERTCGDCGKTITVADNRTYPDRVVYCRPCYLEYLEKEG